VRDEDSDDGITATYNFEKCEEEGIKSHVFSSLCCRFYATLP
jgi:hypothetical protein